MRSAPRIAIVGVCGSGKTVLARALAALGYNARAMAQEHSFVPGMWRAHGQPNVLICLDAEPETINDRLQRRDWTAEAVADQRRRLADALAYCDLHVPTDGLTEAEVLEVVVAFLRAGWPEDTSAGADAQGETEQPRQRLFRERPHARRR